MTINSTTGKYCSVAFILMLTLIFFRISSTDWKDRTTLYVTIPAPQESTAQLLPCEWSNFRSLSRIKRYNHLVQHNRQHHREVQCFSVVLTLKDLIHRLTSWNTSVFRILEWFTDWPTDWLIDWLIVKMPIHVINVFICLLISFFLICL